ncbi:helix-turn-helix domain-containing protein [Paenibacillus sp. EC2-1]|uniref:helix-turn-helix domain-containing protein n=1 Tax=Paenibacillus sp. EC2-1 TaxID=3388665 RepID=UPI003BEEDFD6
MDLRLKAGNHNIAVDFISTRHISGRKGRITGLHSHPVFHLMFITEGEGRFQVGETFTEAKEGMLYVIDPNVPHQFYASDDQPLSNYESTFLLLDEIGEPLTMSFTELITLDEEFVKQPIPLHIPVTLQPLLVDGFQNVIDAQKSKDSLNRRVITLIDLMFRTIDVLLRMRGGSDADRGEKAFHVVARLKQLFQANVHRNVSLQEMSQFVHLSPNYLCRLFKRETGMPPQQFFLQMKMEEAMKQMLYTDLPIYLVADHLGFENATYFTRLFRAKTGVSPSEYRKQGRQLEG